MVEFGAAYEEVFLQCPDWLGAVLTASLPAASLGICDVCK